MVLTRLGMLHLTQGRGPEAVAAFRSAYGLAGSPDNILSEYVEALCLAGKAADAIEMLLAEANRGSSTPLRRQVLAELLLWQPAAVADPVAFVDQRLRGERDSRIKLKADLGLYASELGRHDVAVAFLEQAYAESGNAPRYAEPTGRALINAGRHGEAFDLMLRAIAKGPMSPGLAQALAEAGARAQLKADDLVARLDKALEHRPEARAELCLALGRAAMDRRNPALAAAALSRACDDGALPANLVEHYVGSLIATVQLQKALVALERFIQGGYHTRWAFDTLAELYQKTGREKAEAARATSCMTELFPLEER